MFGLHSLFFRSIKWNVKNGMKDESTSSFASKIRDRKLEFRQPTQSIKMHRDFDGWCIVCSVVVAFSLFISRLMWFCTWTGVAKIDSRHRRFACPLQLPREYCCNCSSYGWDQCVNVCGCAVIIIANIECTSNSHNTTIWCSRPSICMGPPFHICEMSCWARGKHDRLQISLENRREPKTERKIQMRHNAAAKRTMHQNCNFQLKYCTPVYRAVAVVGLDGVCLF